MSRILNILCLTLLININAYTNNTINYNNTDFYNRAKDYLEDRITELHSDNTKTHFDLRNIMKDASFSYEGNKIVATFNQQNTINQKNTTNQTVIINKYGKSIDGYTYNENYNNENQIINDNIVDKYSKILFFIDKQYTLSILNFKLNNKLTFNKTEINLASIFNDIENKKEGIKAWNLKWCPYYYIMIKQYDSEPYEIPFSLYYDVREIIKNNKVKNHADQLKLDIYKQIQDMKNNLTQYDEKFKVLHMYFINQFYEKNKIASACENYDIEKEIEIEMKNNITELHYDLLYNAIKKSSKERIAELEPA